MKNKKCRVFLSVLGLCMLFCMQPVCASELYWDKPVQISETDARFPQAVGNDTVSAVIWQSVDTRRHQIRLSGRFCGQDGTWTQIERFTDAFIYSGDVPDMYSAAVLDNGTVVVAVLSDLHTISVYTSSDQGQHFERMSLPRQDAPLVAPRMYTASDGRLVLFTSLADNESFSILYSESYDGYTWTDFRLFAPSGTSSNPFIPVLCRVPDGDVIVFQSQYRAGNRLSYQLFSTKSTDDGVTWSEPLLLTDTASLPVTRTEAFSDYNNQRPALLWRDDMLYMAWERTYYASENAHIWTAVLDSGGRLVGEVQELTYEGNAGRPVLFEFERQLSLVWFDTRSGSEQVYLAQKNGLLWDERRLSSGSESHIFCFPVRAGNSQEPAFIWQTNPVRKNSVSSISWLGLDKSVPAPVLTGITFKDGGRGTAKTVKVRIGLPADPSGIAGYAWSWSQDPLTVPDKSLMALANNTTLTMTADQDSVWYLKVRVQDYAGNWSEPAVISYFRDTTPPKKPVLEPFATDSYGFALSNNVLFRWSPDRADDDIAGYTWSLDYAAELEKKYAVYPQHPMQASGSEAVQRIRSASDEIRRKKLSRLPLRILGKNASARFDRQHNGVYVFSVAAVDTVGNIGAAARVTVVLNKFIPRTDIYTASAKTDMFGIMKVDVQGEGFMYDGTIQNVYVDRDGKAPYDLVLSEKDYTVLSDGMIAGITVAPELEAGEYCIGLSHPVRGIFFSKPLFTKKESGTVKIQKMYSYEPEWLLHDVPERRHVQMSTVLVCLLICMFTCGLLAAVYGIVGTVRGSLLVRREVYALLSEGTMTGNKRKKTMAKKHLVLWHRGIGLKIKLMSFSILLVLMVVGLVVTPLQSIMLRTEEQNLAEGLKNRVEVLMDSMALGVRAYMPTMNVLELSYLPAQSSAMQEALYGTITGAASVSSNKNLDFIWASNDPDIQDKIDGDVLTYGGSRIIDDDMQKVIADCMELNGEASARVQTIARDIAELYAEGSELALKTDEESVRRRNDIAEITRQLDERMTEILEDLSNSGSGSYPEYNMTRLDHSSTSYLFYKPVLYRQSGNANYVHGIVFLRVSTDNLLKTVAEARKTVLLTSAVIAFIAAVLGAIGALIVATIIVRPIRRLAAHVAMIGETRDKEKLIGRELKITSHDEIGALGETVNNMTRELIKAAQEEHLMMDGKVVQQTFLPLASNKSGGRETTSVLKEKNIECFGYYEGASSVSGDYYDYKKLDSRWYVIIKCDVSGHGVPAALIMTVVATLFRTYFDGWSFETKGLRINELVTRINDFIESLGLKGKFATIILCLFDTQTGTVYMCNAGDNLVHFYDSALHEEKTVSLVETPAAGPLPSFMVDMKGGFKVEKAVLNHNDVMFLYTDGIEEATRKFRNENFEVTKCMEPGLQEGADHCGHKVGQESEQLMPERIKAVIESVFARKTYELVKFHNPLRNEKLVFDFTTCEGTIEEAVLALVSVEKVFRMYKDPDVTAADMVRVDRKVDAFLQKHFNLYDFYCANKSDNPDDLSYLYYTYLKEDEQLDDLTLVAVKRP